MALRLLLFVLVALWSTPSFAGALVLLPGTAVVGDGKSPATLRVWAAGITGEDKIKINPDEGRVGEASIGADGVITFSWFPPPVKAPRELGLSVKVTGVNVRAEERLTVAVVPPYAGNLKVSFDPPAFVGGNAGVQVRITPDASSAQNAESRRMMGVASAGTLDAPIAAGDGTYVAYWKPPASMPKSRSVIIAVADAAAPDQVVGWAVLPVLVKASVTLNAMPGSNNLLIAGDKQWGPLPASPAGTVAFDVEVDPGKTAARLQTVAPGGAKTETVVNLPLEDYSRVAFFPVPPAMPSDPGARLKLRVAATKITGEPLSNAAITLRATAGQVEPMKATGQPGVYEATFIPPEKAGEVIFTAEVDGQKAEARMKLVNALPSVSLSAEPSELPKGQTSATITARVKDARGAGVVGQPPELTVTGGSKPAKPTDNKDGSYTWKVTLASKPGYMIVTADPPVEASGLGPSRVLVWPGRASVAANGSESVSVTVAVLDAFGLPVPNTKVKLAVPVGDGSLAPEATTNKAGLARVAYRAGTAVGPAVLRADAAGLYGEAVIFQSGPGALAPNPTPTGSPDGIAALTGWQMAAPALLVAQEGSSPTAKAGPPAVVTLTTVPPYTTPGAAILVVARVTDAAGIAVTKQKLVATASPGTAGAVTDNGDGSYSFPVQLPAGVDGPLTLTVKASSAQGSIVLPTLMGMNAAMMSQPATGGGNPGVLGSMSGGGGGGGGGGTARAPKTRQPKTGGGLNDNAWARLSASLGTVPHKYKLCQIDENKDCVTDESEGFDDDIVPDEAAFSSVFGPALDVRALVWPGDRSFGLTARARGYIDPVEVGGEKYTHFTWTLHAGARYRNAFSDTGKWYVNGEIHRLNGLVFLYEDEAATSAVLVSKGLWAARVGGGVIFDLDKLYVDLSLTESFAPFPVDTALGAELAYDLDSGMFIRAGFDFDFRPMTFSVDDADRVRVVDQERAITVGVGKAF